MGGGVPQGTAMTLLRCHVDRAAEAPPFSVPEARVLLVWPGERMEILMRFEGKAGLSLLHCHNLEPMLRLESLRAC